MEPDDSTEIAELRERVDTLTEQLTLVARGLAEHQDHVRALQENFHERLERVEKIQAGGYGLGDN